MFSAAPHLERVNKIEKTSISPPSKTSLKLSKSEIKSNIDNFYMTDSVSRNSPTMSKCSVAFNLQKNSEN